MFALSPTPPPPPPTRKKMLLSPSVKSGQILERSELALFIKEYSGPGCSKADQVFISLLNYDLRADFKLMEKEKSKSKLTGKNLLGAFLLISN